MKPSDMGVKPGGVKVRSKIQSKGRDMGAARLLNLLLPPSWKT